MSAQARHYEDKLAFEIDSWDLKVAIDAGEPIVVIDARPASAYGKRHIPTAINLPHRQMAEADLSFIPAGATVVVYCDGIGCNASTKGALNMTRLGFPTRELIGGLDWWLRDGYPVRTGTAPGSFAEAPDFIAAGI
ncbi:MAG: rhodanese-like domain-containing protein [Hyphomicrobiales bacterium]